MKNLRRSTGRLAEWSAIHARRAVEVALVAVVVVLFGLPLFRGLGNTDLDNDEAIYSYSVDRILETGDWLSPQIIPLTNEPGDPADYKATFLEKPPLKFWLVAAGIRLGTLPHDEFGLRFWDALFGLVAFVYVFLIGRRTVDSVCGVAAAFLLFLQWQLLFVHGFRSNAMDSALVLAYCGGIYHFLACSREHSSRRAFHVFAVVGWFALGFMTKFVAALFLPMVLGATALLSADIRRTLIDDRWHWMRAWLLALAVIAPWFVYQLTLEGAGLWRVMFGTHVVTRFTASLDPAHIQPRDYYLTQLRTELEGIGALGWVTVGLVLWVIQMFRCRSAERALVLLWCVAPIWLISLGTSKIYHYTYPFLPAIALLGAYPVALLAKLVAGRSSDAPWLDAMITRCLTVPLENLSRRAVASAHARTVLGVIAVAALALLVATVTSGPVILEMGDLVTFSNSSVVGPALVSLACGLAFFLTQRRITAALPVVLILCCWPLARYNDVLERTSDMNRPLRVLRDCLLEQYRALQVEDPEARSSVYVHLPPGEGLTSNYYYYFRVFDEWERPTTYDVSWLHRRLLVPGDQVPTLILESTYREFVRGLERPAVDSQTESSWAEELPGAVKVRARSTTEAVLLLPGPFRICEEGGFSAGGEPVTIEFTAASND